MGTRISLAAFVVVAIVVGAAPRAWARRADDRHLPDYYYMVSGIDGSQKLERLNAEEAEELGETHDKTYKEAAKSWLEAKKDWLKAVGNHPFPVPQPRRPRIRRLGRCRGRKDEEDRYRRRLESWCVCVVTDHTGRRSAELIREDRLLRRQIELMRGYVDAAKGYVASVKEDPEVAKDPNAKPTAPSVRPLKKDLRDEEKAAKWTGLLEKKLEKEAEEEAKQREKEEALRRAREEAARREKDAAAEDDRE
jgi:hypothetical protein